MEVTDHNLDGFEAERKQTMTQRTRTLWTFAITSIALFMVSLDNLVVSTAIPVIRSHRASRS